MPLIFPSFHKRGKKGRGKKAKRQKPVESNVEKTPSQSKMGVNWSICQWCKDTKKGVFTVCPNGHILCGECDKRIKISCHFSKVKAECPLCWTIKSRLGCHCKDNLLGRVRSDLVECPRCKGTYTEKTLSKHRRSQCAKRMIHCKFNTVGCRYVGEAWVIHSHEGACIYPHISPKEVSTTFQFCLHNTDEVEEYTDIGQMLLANEMVFKQVALYANYRYSKSYTSDEFVAFGYEWRIKGRFKPVEQPDKDSKGQSQILCCSLVLVTPIKEKLNVMFMYLKNPYFEDDPVYEMFPHSFIKRKMTADWRDLPFVEYANETKPLRFNFAMFPN